MIRGTGFRRLLLRIIASISGVIFSRQRLLTRFLIMEDFFVLSRFRIMIQLLVLVALVATISIQVESACAQPRRRGEAGGPPWMKGGGVGYARAIASSSESRSTIGMRPGSHGFGPP